MADEEYTFTQARARLDDLVVQVRRKDLSLEQSIDLLEEGVRLANSCTELIDHAEWRAAAGEDEEQVGEGDPPTASGAADSGATAAEDSAAEDLVSKAAEGGGEASDSTDIDAVEPDETGALG